MVHSLNIWFNRNRVFPQNSVSSRYLGINVALQHRYKDLRASVGNNDRCSLLITGN